MNNDSQENYMKLLTAALTTLVATSSFAHVNPGPHKGTDNNGQACEMIAGTTYFLNNQKHPLNERIEIKVGNDTFVVGHPPIISAQDKLAYFDHDQFQGILPTPVGAKALIIKMEHSETFEGPTGFTLITHEYKNDTRNSLDCQF